MLAFAEDDEGGMMVTVGENIDSPRKRPARPRGGLGVFLLHVTVACNADDRTSIPESKQMKACAILSCVFGLMGIFVMGLPFGIAAIVLGAIGGAAGYAYAWAGMTLGIVHVLYVGYWLLRMMGEL